MRATGVLACAAAAVALLALVATPAHADVYINSPRGSNNRLDEANRDRDNGDRLFDSQVGAPHTDGSDPPAPLPLCRSRCRAAAACTSRAKGLPISSLVLLLRFWHLPCSLCALQNNDRGGYNVGNVYYYTGSTVPIEWTAQHSCGDKTRANCEIILQYACDDRLRDGTTTTTIPINPNQCYK